MEEEVRFNKYKRCTGCHPLYTVAFGIYSKCLSRVKMEKKFE